MKTYQMFRLRNHELVRVFHAKDTAEVLRMITADYNEHLFSIGYWLINIAFEKFYLKCNGKIIDLA